MSESSLSANLRANEQEQHSKAEPQGESAQHDEAHLDQIWEGKCCGCAEKDHALTRGDLPDFATTVGGSASCSNAGGDWAEVSRRHRSGVMIL